MIGDNFMQQISLTSLLHTSTLKNKRVFLRADLNIPIHDGVIKDDYRLQAIVPTIDLILQKGGKIILATHIGRPKNHEPALSTKHLIPWFKNHNYKHHYKIEYEPDLDAAHAKSYNDFDTILLLENMRFYPGEKKSDPLFAQQLAQLGDYYVNDAFALVHRHDTSITLVPELFAPDQRTIGLLIEKELRALQRLLENPAKPFTLILGGGKVADKLPLLYALIDQIDTVLLCPATVFTFLKTQNKPVGLSLVDTTKLDSCKQFILEAHQKKINVMMPIDYQIADKSFDGPLSLVSADRFPADGVGISIGPDTAKLFAQEIQKAGTIFFNGLMGSINRPETLQGADALFKAMIASPGVTIVGGGDSVAAARLLQVNDQLDFLSTGGGATLAYLTGQELPGLACFIKKPDRS